VHHNEEGCVDVNRMPAVNFVHSTILSSSRYPLNTILELRRDGDITGYRNTHLLALLPAAQPIL